MIETPQFKQNQTRLQSLRVVYQLLLLTIMKSYLLSLFLLILSIIASGQGSSGIEEGIINSRSGGWITFGEETKELLLIATTLMLVLMVEGVFCEELGGFDAE